MRQESQNMGDPAWDPLLLCKKTVSLGSLTPATAGQKKFTLKKTRLIKFWTRKIPGEKISSRKPFSHFGFSPLLLLRHIPDNQSPPLLRLQLVKNCCVNTVPQKFPAQKIFKPKNSGKIFSSLKFSGSRKPDTEKFCWDGSRGRSSLYHCFPWKPSGRPDTPYICTYRYDQDFPTVAVIRDLWFHRVRA